MFSGTIRYFDADSGHGFIEPHSGPIRAHIFVVSPRAHPEICSGMQVCYELSRGAGRALAIRIRPLRDRHQGGRGTPLLTTTADEAA